MFSYPPDRNLLLLGIHIIPDRYMSMPDEIDEVDKIKKLIHSKLVWLPIIIY